MATKKKAPVQTAVSQRGPVKAGESFVPENRTYALLRATLDKAHVAGGLSEVMGVMVTIINGVSDMVEETHTQDIDWSQMALLVRMTMLPNIIEAYADERGGAWSLIEQNTDEELDYVRMMGEAALLAAGFQAELDAGKATKKPAASKAKR